VAIDHTLGGIRERSLVAALHENSETMVKIDAKNGDMSKNE
jgi:hypothetical protein